MTEPHATSPTDDTWSMLALPPKAARRHFCFLLALRTFPPHPVTGIRSMKWPRLVAATGLSDKTAKLARDELIEWGAIQYTAGDGRGNYSEYWIIPVAPVKVDAPPGKVGTQGAPLLVPGKVGTPEPERGVPPADKGGYPLRPSPAETQTQGEVPQGEVLQEPHPQKTTAYAGSSADERLRDTEDQTRSNDKTDLTDLIAEDIARQCGGLSDEEERLVAGMLADAAFRPVSRLAIINKIKADRRRNHPEEDQ